MKQFDPIRHLRILNNRGKLALFIGAGISRGCNLPDWNTLLDSLMNKAFPNQTNHKIETTKNFSAISRARLIKSKLGDNFHRTIAEELYKNEYGPFKAVMEIVRSGVRRICTYNFDDLLEEAYATEKFKTHSIVDGENFNNNFRGTAIYHPHGILPSNATFQELRAARIVFSEEEYHKLYSTPYSWANLIQLHLLMSHTCLFIGASMQDPNIRRLLDTFVSLKFTHRHYAVFRSPLYAVSIEEKPLARQAMLTLESDLSNLGVNPIWINTFDALPDLIKSIRNKKEKN